MRDGGDGMRCDGRGLDGWSDDLGRMMWRIRNREGLKQADDIRRKLGGRNLRTEWFT